MSAPERPHLGFLGIGLMGRPMTLRLLDAGYRVAVWNRNRDKLAEVVARGALEKGSAAEVARDCDLLMLCLTDQQAVCEVLLGPAGVLEGARPGLVVVDFSSIAPPVARDIAQRFLQAGVGFVDAPVSGGTVGAEKGSLAIMAGGALESLEAARPVLAHLAARLTHMGGPGAGQVTKLANQLIVAQLFPVLAEAIRLAEAGGVDGTRLPEALRGGFADSIPLQVFGPRMAARTWSPALGTTAVMLKDLRNVLALADAGGLELPLARAALERYEELEQAGRTAEEPSAFIDLITAPTAAGSTEAATTQRREVDPPPRTS